MAEPIGAAGQVRRRLDGAVLTLTLDRGERNALVGPLADELVEALRAGDADPRVRAIVLTGAGAAFSAGADLGAGPDALRRVLAADGADRPGYREPAGRITAAMATVGVPVVAAVNGDAVGGGATIVLGADVRFAADSARFGFPFTRLGVCPEGASTYLLPRLVGIGRATEWLLSGRLVDAAEALASGLVTRLLSTADVLQAAQEWAADLAARTSPAAVATTKRLLAVARSQEATSAAESRAIVELIGGPDCPEGVAAFLERRPPRFAARPTISAG
jgi:enoyl-CoA hydratase/carnithine racemase